MCSQNLCRHLNNVFVHLGNDPGENLGHNSARLSLPARHSIHKVCLAGKLTRGESGTQRHPPQPASQA